MRKGGLSRPPPPTPYAIGTAMSYDYLNHTALVVMYIGLFGWLAAAGMFIYRGFRKNGRVRFRKALTWFAVLFVMLVVWIAGLVFLGHGA